MRIWRVGLVVCFIALCSFTSVHKYYLSLTELKYVEDEKSLQMISELFIDDLEKVLRNRYDNDIHLVENNTSEKSKSYIKLYLNDKVTILVNGQKINFNFLGFEYKEDKIVCYLEALDIPKISTFEVTNNLLLEMYSKQKNIVKLKVDDIEKSVLLIKGKETEQIIL